MPWPSATTVFGSRGRRFRVTESLQSGTHAGLLRRAAVAGTYYLEVKATAPTPASGRYSLRVSRSPATRACRCP